MTADEADKLLDDTNAKLGEFFEAVQIMATWSEAGSTHASYRGVGNWHARSGLAHRFIEGAAAFENAEKLRAVLPPPDDDGEGWKSAAEP